MTSTDSESLEPTTNIEIESIDVYHPFISRTAASFFNFSGHDHHPYTIQVNTKQGNYRVHRSYETLSQLNEALKAIVGSEIQDFPVRKKHFGLMGSFADSESGEQRRNDLAKYLIQTYKKIQNNRAALDTYFEYMGVARLFDAIEAGEVEGIRVLLQARTQSVFDYQEDQHFSCLHYLSVCARKGLPNAGQIASVLLEFGADLNQLDSQFRSPLMVAFWGENTGLSLSWEDYVQTLIGAGADLAEQREGNTFLHLSNHHISLAEIIITTLNRIKDKQNHHGDTPYSQAIKTESVAVANLIRKSGGRTNEDIEVINKTLEEENKTFDGFLDLAEERGDHNEVAAILLRLADLKLVEQPLSCIKILNATLNYCQQHDLEQEETYQKLFQAYHRVASVYEYSLNSIDDQKLTLTLKKNRTKLQETRTNIDYQLSHKSIDQALKWITERYMISFKSAIDDSLAVMPAPPCAYTLISLGSLARNESLPSSPLHFALLVEKTTLDTLEFFRLLVKMIEVSVINLQETPYKIFKYRSVSQTIAGVRFDYHNNTPLLHSEYGHYSLVCSPFQLATVQEPSNFQENGMLAMSLLEANYVLGDKKLFESFRNETEKLLNRKIGITTRSLRQTRASALIRAEIKEFVPKMNRDIDTESRFEYAKHMCMFPSKVIDLLCLYYSIPTNGLSTWDRIDRLSSAGQFSKAGATNLKKAISSIMNLYIKTGESKVVEIRTAIEAYNRTLDPDSTPINQSLESESEQEEPEFDMEQEGSGMKTATKKKKDLYSLTHDDIDQIVQAYLTLLPLHQVMKEWLNVEARDAKKATEILKTNVYFNENDDFTLAEAYFRLCHYKKAEQHYRKAIDHDATNSVLVNALGVMYNKIGDYANAIHYYEKAVGIIQKAKGDLASELGTQYNNLAMANINLKLPLVAIDWLEKALKIDEHVYGKTHPYVGQDYHNIGLLAKQENQLEKAIEYVKQALEIDNAHYGHASAQVGTDLFDLGKIYAANKQHQEALNYFTQAEQVFKQVYSGHHTIIASLLVATAQVYRALDEKSNSMAHYLRALEIQRQLVGDNHLATAAIMYEIGVLHADFDELEEAVSYVRNARDSYEACDKNHPDLPQVERILKEYEIRLRRKISLSPEEYEEWKSRINAMSQEEFQGMMTFETEEAEREPEPAAVKIFSSGQIGKWKDSVFENDFYEL